MRFASVGSRFGSMFIDGFILGVLKLVLLILAGIGGLDYGESQEMMFIPGILMYFAYMTYYFGNGHTPGMSAMKIKLIRTDGNPEIGYKTGFLRYLGMMVSSLVLFIGYLWILIDENKQGWHDKIAGVYVVVEDRFKLNGCSPQFRI